MPLRPESSVSVGFDEFGELVFDGDKPGPVLHRTPEELGIPRELKDVPRVPSWFKPQRDTGPGSAGRSLAVRKVARKMQELRPRVIGGELVAMAAGAMMGAEPLGGFIAERRETRGVKVDRRQPAFTADQELQLVADAKTMNIDELAKKHSIKQWKVYAVLKAHGAKSVRKPMGTGARKGVKGRALVPAARRAAASARAVEIDPGRPGSASALIDALARADDERLEIGFTVREVATILGRLDGARRAAFLAAGIKAALLA